MKWMYVWFVFIASVSLASCQKEKPVQPKERVPEPPKVVTSFTKGEPLDLFPLDQRSQAVFMKSALFNAETLPDAWTTGLPIPLDRAGFDAYGLDWEKPVGLINYGCSYVAELSDRTTFEAKFSFSDEKPPHEKLSRDERMKWSAESSKKQRPEQCDWRGVDASVTFYRMKTYNDKWEIFRNFDARRTIGIYADRWVVFSEASTVYALSNDNYLKEGESPVRRGDVFGEVAIFPYQRPPLFASLAADGTFHVQVPVLPQPEEKAVDADAVGPPESETWSEVSARLLNTKWNGSPRSYYFSEFGDKKIFEKANPKKEELRELRVAASKTAFERLRAEIEKTVVSNRLVDAEPTQSVVAIEDVAAFLKHLHDIGLSDETRPRQEELIAELDVLQAEYREKVGSGMIDLLGGFKLDSNVQSAFGKDIFGKSDLKWDTLGGLSGNEFGDSAGFGGLGTRGIGSGGGGTSYGIGIGKIGSGNGRTKSAGGVGIDEGVRGGDTERRGGGIGRIDLGPKKKSATD